LGYHNSLDRDSVFEEVTGRTRHVHRDCGLFVMTCLASRHSDQGLTVNLLQNRLRTVAVTCLAAKF
jgi:hypothetical protein